MRIWFGGLPPPKIATLNAEQSWTDFSVGVAVRCLVIVRPVALGGRMHYKGWSRDQAIEFFVDNAPKSCLDIVNEIDSISFSSA